MIKWFPLAARKIIVKIKLPRQTQRFMDRHQNYVKRLASAINDPETKRNIILKPGGGGFLGGVIFRCLIRWDGNKLMRRKRTTSKKKKTRKTKAPRRKRKDPVKARQPRAKKSRKKINDKFVTKRRNKSISPLASKFFNPSPIASTSWQNLGMSSPRSNARQSLTVTRFSSLRASPQQIISLLNPRQFNFSASIWICDA